MTFDFQTFAYADVCSHYLRKSDRELLSRHGLIYKPNGEPFEAVNLLLIGTAAEPGPRHTGWFVAIGNKFDEEDRAYLLEVGFSEEFAEIIWQLVKQKIFYVRFDAEGYELEGAPTFE